MARLPPTARPWDGGLPERRTPVGEPAPAIPVVPAKILGPRVGVCLRWSLACPLDDGAHLLSVERLHGRGPDVAEGAALQRDGGGRLVVGEVGDRDDVVFAKGPDQLADLAAVLFD
jgi:hypothetical protein